LLDVAAREHQRAGHDGPARESVQKHRLGIDGGKLRKNPRDEVFEMIRVVLITGIIPRIPLRFVKGDTERTAVCFRLAESLRRCTWRTLDPSEHEPNHIRWIRIDSVQDHD